mmetsp:Transcript_7199/g.15794  ORF Transcript_7199/g.15794 Transcript_7199/m.15794 type:complete len:136 (+) Transcript_7199:332-739(+)
MRAHSLRWDHWMQITNESNQSFVLMQSVRELHACYQEYFLDSYGDAVHGGLARVSGLALATIGIDSSQSSCKTVVLFRVREGINGPVFSLLQLVPAKHALKKRTLVVRTWGTYNMCTYPYKFLWLAPSLVRVAKR